MFGVQKKEKEVISFFIFNSFVAYFPQIVEMHKVVFSESILHPDMFSSHSEVLWQSLDTLFKRGCVVV